MLGSLRCHSSVDTSHPADMVSSVCVHSFFYLKKVNYLVDDDQRGRKNERQEVFPANTAMRSRLLIKKSKKSIFAHVDGIICILQPEPQDIQGSKGAGTSGKRCTKDVCLPLMGFTHS